MFYRYIYACFADLFPSFQEKMSVIALQDGKLESNVEVMWGESPLHGRTMPSMCISECLKRSPGCLNELAGCCKCRKVNFYAVCKT